MMKSINNFNYYLKNEHKTISFDPKSMINVSKLWKYLDQQKTRFGNSIFTQSS